MTKRKQHSLFEKESKTINKKSRDSHVEPTPAELNEANAQHRKKIADLTEEFEDLVEGIENHYKGSCKRKDMKRIDKIEYELADMNIPTMDIMGKMCDDSIIIDNLIERSQKLRDKKGKHQRAGVPRKTRQKRAEVAGLLRAMAEVKGYGNVAECHNAIRELVFPERKNDKNRREIENVLAADDGVEKRAYYKAVFEKAFTQEEVTALNFPQEDDQYEQLKKRILNHVRAWSKEHPEEFKKIHRASLGIEVSKLPETAKPKRKIKKNTAPRKSRKVAR